MATTLDGAVGGMAFAEKGSLARHERIVNGFATVTQFLTWPLLFFIFRTIFSIRIRGRENFRSVKAPFIIISNHVSFYDSFLFRLVLGFWTPHLPLRFMGVTKFHWRFLNLLSAIGVIELVYSLFGVFTVVPGLGIGKNLEKAREIISVGGNVVMFPEGRIFVEDPSQTCHIGPFKKGAAVLMKETGVDVVPVTFHIIPHWFRRKICVNVGTPMKLVPELSVDEITHSFHVAMEGLYERE